MYGLNRESLLGLMLGVLAIVGPPHATAAPIIDVFPSVAPNKFDSPSWPGYVNNAVNLSLTGGVENGGASRGNPASPTFYSSTSSISTADLIVTGGFNSWHGFANPGSVFGPAFANETGNRATFGVHINGNGQIFSLSQVGFSVVPSNPALAPFLGFSGTLASLDYTNPTQVNTVVGREASNNQLVLDPAVTDQLKEMWYVGVGVALEVDSTDPGATFQDKINNTLTDPLLQSPFSLTGTYTLPGFSGSGSVEVTPSGPLSPPIPEPSTFALFAAGAGLAGALARWRRRRATA